MVSGILKALPLPHRREVISMDLFATLVIGILAGVIANLMTEYIIHHWQH